jgi:F-type H+-transporting ATPase subunit alpha
LDKGVRNVEILKQPQNSPYTVEDQLAIIYCGMKGLLQKVPVRNIRDFEAEYLLNLRENHLETLQQLKAGNINDDITNVLESVCKEVARKYER